MVRDELMARLFASPALTSHVMEYLDIDKAFACGVVSHTFYDAVSLISHAVATPLVLRHPHVFARLKAAQTVLVECANEEDMCRIIAIACSSVRKWKDLHIFMHPTARNEGDLVGHFDSLAGAIRSCLPELEDLNIHGIDSMMAASSTGGAEVRTAALRVLSAMPNNLALRCGLSWGLPIDRMREFAAGANVDLNLQSEYMDPVSICFAVRGKLFTDDCRSFMRDLVAAGMKLDVVVFYNHRSSLGISIEMGHYSTALEFLQIGCDPNLGFPCPLVLLCKSTMLNTGLVTHQDVEVMEALLGAGANPFASFDGKTAMDSLISQLKEYERADAMHNVTRMEVALTQDPESFVGDELINAARPDEHQNQLKAGKAALLEMQSLLIRAMHESHQRLRRAKAKARTKKQ
jgi:hypothetical protein